ncbi:hypothetical protein SAMN04488066_10683 [Halorubrum aquaticum]|uniref:Uncharacterized protein n=1 Tax=Halorubrum aquaticum TaxID=387340 RepID=A0A1I3ALL4_9EURY|nr:hypothetical protein [Halorubrum aquaticum]SFH50619.1 hypothetical protein SAMN04488066_10683 [Halorubrum aquaticum]
MQRRKFVVGLGALASGSAAAVGTGAFTSVEADRNVDVEVAGDDAAYLGLRKAAGPNTDPGANSDAYLDTSGAEVSLDFSSSNGTTDLGDGFNPNSVTEIDDLIEVQNQGTQSAYLSVDLADLDLTDDTGTPEGTAYVGLAVREDETTSSNLNDNIAFDSSGDPDPWNGSTVPDPSNDGAYELTQGESVHLDLTVDTTDFEAADVSTSGSITFIADQDSSL